jgi:hypothetical protein
LSMRTAKIEDSGAVRAMFNTEIGQQFGCWRVLELVPRLLGRPRFVICRCECGVRGVVRIQDLQLGRSLSCGCRKVSTARRKLSRRETFHEWAKTWRLARAHSAVKVCERWRSFSSFLDDAGLRPRGMILVRIDEREPFGPENFRWAHRKRGSVLASTQKK